MIGADAGANVDDVVRHIELERRLRLGPYVGDGSDERRLVRFPLTLDEWKELRVLRETHGEGEEWGEGEERIYWRSKCEDNVVSIHRRLPRLILRGRALS